MLVVVGGQTRDIGKSSVVAGIIRRLPAFQWTAVKITQFGHADCSRDGHACECGPADDHPYALSEEFEPGKTDSARFLAAGARRSFWLRTAAGRLAGALPAIEKIMNIGLNTIVESNSLLEFMKPDLYLMVLDFAEDDFKASALRFMDRADAFVVIDRGLTAPLWEHVSRGVWDDRPHFLVRPPHYVPAAVCALVRARASGSGPQTA